MTQTFRRLGPSELLPRYIFAESLVARRRVLEVGAVASTGGQSAQFLVQRGARSVLACDSDVAAVEAAQAKHGSASLRFRANVFDDLEPQSFDLVVVADLSRYVAAPELLGELARLTAKNGYLVGGLRNLAGLALSQVMDPDDSDPPPTYGQLFDALSAHFPHIEVATQSPVLGYQLAFERGEGLQVDGSLAQSTEAAYFVVVAGHEPVRSFDPTWVQLPPEPLAFNSGKLEEYASRTRGWEERTRRLNDVLAHSRTQLKERETEVADLKSAFEKARDESSRLVAQLETQRSHPVAARDRDELAVKVRRLESELQVARERAEDAERRVAAQRAEFERWQKQQKESSVQFLAGQEELRQERARKDELSSLLEDARGRLAKAYEELRDSQDSVAKARLDSERARLAQERLEEEVRDRLRELESAREREIRIAEQHSTALAAVDHLKAEVERAQASAQASSEQLALKESELARALRIVDAESRSATDAKAALVQEREELRNTVEALRMERVALEADLASAQNEVRELERDLARNTADEHKTRDQVQELSAVLNASREEAAAARQRAEELEVQIEVARARSQRFEKDITTAVGAERSAREQLEVARGELETRLTSALAEAQTAREQLDAVRAEAQAAREQVDVVRAELEEKLKASIAQETSVREQVEAARTELEQQLKSALERESSFREQAEADRTELEAKLQSALASERTAREQVEVVRAELEEKLQSAVAGERAAREQLDAARAELEEKLKSLQREKEQSEADQEEEHRALIAQRDGLVSSAQEERQRLEAQLAALQQEKSDFVEKVSALQVLEEKERSTRDRAEALDAERERLEQRLRAAEERADAQRQDLERSSDRVEVLEAERRGVAEERDRLMVEVDRVESERAKMTEQLEQLQMERSRLAEDGDRLSLELKNSESQQAALRAEMDALAREKLRREEQQLPMEKEVLELRQRVKAATERQTQLTSSLEDRDKRLDSLQRRLAAQETELLALRRMTKAGGPNQVQQIYERASEQLTAAKEEIHRTASTAPVKATPSSPKLPAPPPVSAPASEVKAAPKVPAGQPAPELPEEPPTRPGPSAKKTV